MSPTDSDEIRQCFVIMPFGTRTVGTVEVDFDRVYQALIRPALRRAGFEAVRGDEILRGGNLMDAVYERIANEEVVLADITGQNPNVMYELGVRHTLRRSTTIVIQCEAVRPGPDLPFDIGQLRIITYKLDLSDRESFATRVDEFTRNAHLENNPVLSAVEDARRKENETLGPDTPPIGFRLVGAPEREVWIQPGDIMDTSAYAVWVNPENTAMQMARHYDQSISATIRYGGAVRSAEGARPRKDLIADELRKRMRGELSVDVGHVLVTGAGELRASNQVKKIFHVAVVVGRAGKGYRVVDDDDPPMCVRNVLAELDSGRHRGLTSILFPIFGTGTARSPVERVAPKLIRAVVSYLGSHPTTQVRKVGFSARSKHHLDVCRDVLRRLGGVEAIP